MLDKYRVLDLTDEKGCFCGKMLADLGADVIAIEPPSGSHARRPGPFFHDIPTPETSLFWFAYGLGKRSITLDIETRDGRNLFLRLVRKADFVIESSAPGYLENLGLDYPVLAEINPRLIMVSISPFGQHGPYRNYVTSDLVSMAAGGLMFSMGDADRPPLRFSMEQSWPETGAQAAIAALIAGHYRRSSGRGQYIDVSIQECVASLLEHRYHYAGYGEKDTENRRGPRVMRGGGISAPLHTWPCRDGFVCWRLMTAAQAPKTVALIDWMKEEGMSAGLEEIEWSKLDFTELSQDRLDVYESKIGEFFKTHTKAELHTGAVRRGIMLFPVNTAADMLKDAQLASRQFWTEIGYPKLGATLTYPGFPARLDPPLHCSPRPAPRIGEHNLEIYEGELGLTRNQVIMLKEVGAI